MNQERLVTLGLGQLNRGLLIFRIGLYSAAIVGVHQRGGEFAPWAIALLCIVALMPAVPGLSRRIEIGVASTLLLEFTLTMLYGAFLALQIMPMFSLAVAGLFLTRRVAVAATAAAFLFQATTIFLHVRGSLNMGAGIGDLSGESVLLIAAGTGFIGIGAVLREYQRQELNRAREEIRLTELVEEKDRLIDSVAHEIRTPITAVLGFSTQLGSSSGSSIVEVGELAELVATESRRLAHLVDNLVLRSRSDIDKLEFLSEPVELTEVMRRAWTELGHDQETLRINGSGTALADSKRVTQVMKNLFDNSIRHGMLPVTVDIETGTGAIVCKVRDIGPGISPSISSDVFQKYRETGVRSRPDGVGLGLPVAQMLVGQMSGGIRVEAGGITLELPAAELALT